MENLRTFLIVALLAISAVLYQKWLEQAPAQPPISNAERAMPQNIGDATSVNKDLGAIPSGSLAAGTQEALPSTPQNQQAPSLDTVTQPEAISAAQLITITTDMVVVKINPQGGVIESLALRKEPVAIDKPDQGFPLLKKTPQEIFIAQDGLLVSGQSSPNHVQTKYQHQALSYNLGSSDKVVVPLSWRSEDGVEYTKTFVFKRNSYVVDINYQVNNSASSAWQGYLYAQFSRSEPTTSGGAFGQLPSYTGGAYYTEADKYDKVDFDDMAKQNLELNTDSGWVAMLQHYFVGAWMPVNGGAKQFYTSVNRTQGVPTYRIGYKTQSPNIIQAGQSGNIGTSVFLGPKEQKRLKQIEQESNVHGLALTVDYGFLTFIADPLFYVLSLIHGFVGNWGWSIILLTVLIKAVFYPLSAASYKSMAGMKKLQPRITTLKERYKDDKPKFQMEMMALYKKEKINPAGGCLPILVQIPVFISLYWALLESVEIRQAPFALWLQDLSAPDPYYVLPVLMGLSMWAQQKLNPAAMDDIQKKVMMIMPFALTFLFLTFPQGLVLYWVVNNILSMAQQWFINKKYAV